jgi:hypothetical protein
MGITNQLLCITLRKVSNRPLLYGRIRAHEVAFLPIDQMKTFSYSTITVVQTTSDSSEWRPRWSHEYDMQVFVISLIPEPKHHLAISNAFPLSQGDQQHIRPARLIVDERQSSFRVIELICNYSSIFIGFGVSPGKNIPWCDIMTLSETMFRGDFSTPRILVATTEFLRRSKDSVNRTDRVNRSLNGGMLVVASARAGPYTDIEYQERSLSLPGYVLTVCLKSQAPGSKS